MAMDDTYKTLTAPAQGLYKDKGSRFIARAYPVVSEEEVKTILASLRKEYYDARHHCYAWVIEDNRFRYNDDGEPSGTAGKPIYGQLLSHGLVNVLIVVVRYFGGTKLGVRGLINAYKGAAADAIDHAEIVVKIREISYEIRFDYLAMNDVMKIIKDYNLTTSEHLYGLSCQLLLSVREAEEAMILEAFNKIDGLGIKKK